MTFRPVLATSQAQPALEGAGVHLQRVFGFGDPSLTDPFLMMDDFRNDDPRLYEKGFPWHPHRGIETITYVLEGEVEHADSLGNRGLLGAGSVQWMTAGSGILHQEMPKGDTQGRMHGFQLWANLPRDLKMTQPRYQDIAGAELPVEGDEDGTLVKVIIGSYWGKTSPVDGIAADPLLLDIAVPAGRRKRFKLDRNANVLAYVFAGSGRFEEASDPQGILVEKEYRGQEMTLRDQSGNRTLLRFGPGEEIVVKAGDEGLRFLLMSGQPIREPVAWHGPIVMNTREELVQAFDELNKGRFIKHDPRA